MPATLASNSALPLNMSYRTLIGNTLSTRGTTTFVQKKRRAPDQRVALAVEPTNLGAGLVLVVVFFSNVLGRVFGVYLLAAFCGCAAAGACLTLWWFWPLLVLVTLVQLAVAESVLLSLLVRVVNGTISSCCGGVLGP